MRVSNWALHSSGNSKLSACWLVQQAWGCVQAFASCLGLQARDIRLLPGQLLAAEGSSARSSRNSAVSVVHSALLKTVRAAAAAGSDSLEIAVLVSLPVFLQ